VSEQNFIDFIRLCLRSGKGGAGSTHLHREKYVAKGGPAGGDGGHGGNIYAVGNRNMWTLLPLRYKKHIIAGDGQNGGRNERTGADGRHIVLEVPLGTVVKDAETGLIEAEITEHGQKVLLMPGGRGGLGNAHFKSPTHQTPRYAQPGEPGRIEWKVFELKVLADVGLVGFPNAGKSTLLSAISAAKPKIASYPFTTLTPNIGIVSYHDDKSFAMADIPGIIEDAHKGKGLGLKFLRHIERNAVLLYVIPCDAEDIPTELGILKNELYQYNPELSLKPYCVAISKCDMLGEEMTEELKASLPKEEPYLFISSASGLGLENLKSQIWELLERDAHEQSKGIAFEEE
jgi:GTPase